MTVRRVRTRGTGAGRPSTSGKHVAGAAASDPSPWLTLEEAGAYLRVSSRTTMRRLIREEGLPVVRLGGHGHTVRTRREWLDAWLVERAREQANKRNG